MFWRLVAASFIALVLATQGFASSATSPQHRHWKRQIQPATYAPYPDYYPRPNGDRDYVGWAHSSGRRVYFGPSYTYVPGKGIVDEACNLPTSACPNSQRDGY